MKMMLVVMTLLVCCACERVPEEEAAPGAPVPIVEGGATNVLPAPVFDLTQASIDEGQAASNGVQVSALDNLCLLEFEQAGVGLILQVDCLPLGQAPRTLLVTLRSAQAAPAILAGYGVAGAIGAKCALVLDHAARLSFWGYGADLFHETVVPTQRWTSVAATYTGTTLTLYVNGVKIKSGAYALDTPATPLTIGERLVGAISDVRIWDRALTDAEVMAAHTSSMARLR